MAEQHGVWGGGVNTEVSPYCEKMLSCVRKQDEKQIYVEIPEKQADSFQPPSLGSGVRSSCCLLSLSLPPAQAPMS